jgi:ammonia channel protein AmtB
MVAADTVWILLSTALVVLMTPDSASFTVASCVRRTRSTPS